ncbi:hypothetical protein ACIPR9_12630 [Pectobacterium punjabense]
MQPSDAIFSSDEPAYYNYFPPAGGELSRIKASPALIAHLVAVKDDM